MIIRLFGKKVAEIGKGYGLALSVFLFEDGVSLQVMPGVGNAFIRLPNFINRCPHEIAESWGFCMRFEGWSTELHLNWGRKYKIIHFPWNPVHIRHSVLLENGKWHTMGSHEYEKPENAWKRDYPYSYNTGHTVQDVTATVTVEEREWRPALLKHFKWAGRVRKSIDVRFSDEVGAARGSWKGGCVGCSYEMQPGDYPLQTLQRMEFERKFR